LALLTARHNVPATPQAVKRRQRKGTDRSPVVFEDRQLEQ
jgi:hypothetical protein